MNHFPSEVAEALKYYVYKLIDPRDGSVFYIGKGKGDRVFAHCEAAMDSPDEETQSLKIRTIKEILNEGLAPINIIARHGMTEDEAFLVEATLIDNTLELANVVSGHGSTEFGPASAEQLAIRYSKAQMELDDDLRVIAINIRKTRGTKSSVYDAVRFAWRISLDRASKADLVFAVTEGICREVFIPEKWYPATPEHFPNLTEVELVGRHGFVGKTAPDWQRKKYVNKRMPNSLRRSKGMASPILYSYE